MASNKKGPFDLTYRSRIDLIKVYLILMPFMPVTCRRPMSIKTEDSSESETLVGSIEFVK